MNEKLVTVARFSDYMQAELARQLLESQGIIAFVMGQNVATVYGGVLAALDIQLQTPESQADEAMKILEAGRQRTESDGQTEEDMEQDWDEEDEDEDEDGDLEEEQE